MKRKRSQKQRTAQGTKRRKRIEGEALLGSKLRYSRGLAVEYKTVDTYNADSIANLMGGTNLGVLPVNGLAQGTASNGRLGVSVMFKSIELDVMLEGSDTLLDDISIYPSLVYDKSPNGTKATLAQIYTSSTSTDSYWFSGITLPENKDRFTVLWNGKAKWISERITGAGEIPASTRLNPALPRQRWHKFIRMDLPTKFTGSSGSMAALLQGAIYLVIRTNDSTESAASVSYAVRCRFTDA